MLHASGHRLRPPGIPVPVADDVAADFDLTGIDELVFRLDDTGVERRRHDQDLECGARLVLRRGRRTDHYLLGLLLRQPWLVLFRIERRPGGHRPDLPPAPGPSP